MSRKIKVEVGDVVLAGELSDTQCAKAVYNLLPLEKEYETWGDEFYFTINLNMELDETASTEVEVGTIGYWPPGRAIAIFFGPTPNSSSEKPVAASKVNVIGELKDAESLKKVKEIGEIKIVKR
ncbi:MAG: cyclophilin-like fold protein [Thermoplasmatota archaeon]